MASNSIPSSLEGVKTTPHVDSPREMWQETNESRFWRKVKQSPSVPLGILGFLGAIGYGAYMYRYRGRQSTSVYIMKFRVIAQGMVVGAMALGVGITIGQNLIKDKWPSDGSTTNNKS